MVGVIQVPLYDAFHLMFTCWTLRRGRVQRVVHGETGLTSRPSPASWIESLRSPRTAEPYQRTLAWARGRHSLSVQESVGALAFYLVDVTARMYRRQLPIAYLEPYLRELAVLADGLTAGETFADAFATIAD